jgi:hypothetical protein
MNGEYPAIFLNGQNRHVHRLEWEKYHGKPPKGAIIHHIDGNKLNWHISNLQLLSRSDHLKEHKGTVKRPGIKVLAKKDGLELTFNSIEEAAEFCGTYTSGIQRIFKGKQRTANGWIFVKVGDHHNFL